MSKVKIENTDKKFVKKKCVKNNATPKFPKKGQTKPTPTENDSLRLFYTSLLYENPESQMALKWCIEHGLAPGQENI